MIKLYRKFHNVFSIPTRREYYKVIEDKGTIGIDKKISFIIPSKRWNTDVISNSIKEFFIDQKWTSDDGKPKLITNDTDNAVIDFSFVD